MSNFFLIFLIFMLELKIMICHIILPIYSFPKEIYKLVYEHNSIKDFLYSEFKTVFYTILDIGTPPQNIPLLINIETNSFGITSIYPNKINITNKIYLFNFTENFFINNNYSYFNENKSVSFNLHYNAFDSFYKSFYSYSAEDTIFFYQDLNLKNKIKKDEISFLLLRNSEDNITGEIGLNLFDPEYKYFESFLNILNERNLSNFNWYFDFESPKDKKGMLVIGSLPHEIEPKKYSSDKYELTYTKCDSNDYLIYYSMKFDKIYIKNKTNNNMINLENSIIFKYDSNVIIGTYEYNKYLSFILNDLIKEKKCFNDSLQGDSVYVNYSFFYCKNEKDIKNKLYNILPTIYFFSKDFNYTLELTSEDILIENNRYIYIQILYDNNEKNKWKLGKIFSLKYKFIFNPDTRQIGFLKKIKKEENKNKDIKMIIIKILIIAILSIILIILGIKLGKELFRMKRKKRANELNDEYEYFNNENNHVNNIINENEKDNESNDNKYKNNMN